MKTRIDSDVSWFKIEGTCSGIIFQFQGIPGSKKKNKRKEMKEKTREKAKEGRKKDSLNSNFVVLMQIKTRINKKNDKRINVTTLFRDRHFSTVTSRSYSSKFLVPRKLFAEVAIVN